MANAKSILKKVVNVIEQSENASNMSEEILLQRANITKSDYYNALSLSKKTTIIMKRSTSEMNINNYNPIILRALRANMDIKYITNIWACIAYLTSYMCKPERTMSELMRKASKEAHDKEIQHKLFHIGQVFLKCREVSEHEAIARVLSLPLRRSNLMVTYIPTGPKNERTRMMKPFSTIAKMDDEDKDIYLPNIIDKYTARPDNLGNISLAYFCANFTYSKLSQKEDHNIGETDPDITNGDITLKNGLGKMHKRVRPCIIRYHSISKEKESELYHYRLLLLYLPWRHEDELQHEDGSWTSKFLQCQKNIEETIKKFEPYYEIVDEIMENIDLEEIDEDMCDDISPDIERRNYDIEIDPQFLPLDPSILEHTDAIPDTSTRSHALLTSTIFSPDIQYYELINSLNKEQHRLFSYVYQWCIQYCQLQIMGSTDDIKPFYIHLSGGAGVGKSHTIHAIYQSAIRALRQTGQNANCPTVLLTASTGKAAANINGTTIHSAFSLPIRQKGKSFQYRKISSDKLNTLRCLYQNLKILIVDEISMVGGTTLLHLSNALQEICGNELPFGGVSILAVGDLFQLNPVGDRAVFQAPTKDYHALYGSVWKRLFQLYELHEIVIQRSDPEFAQLLSRIRFGEKEPEDIQKLMELENTDMSAMPSNVIHIFFTNAQTMEHNNKMLQTLPSNTICINALDSRKDKDTSTCPVEITSTNIHDTGGLVKTLTVCEGARWIHCKNTDLGDRMVNGITGTIVKLLMNPSYPLKGFIFVEFDDDQVGKYARSKNPSYLKNAVPIRPITVSFPLSRQASVTVERTQFPGMLAWALTAHKAQGSTYSNMVADFNIPNKCISVPPGLAYTIISRATSRQGLKLLNFSPEKIIVNKAALEETVRLQTESPFKWLYPLQKSHPDYVIVAHVNIRSKSHISHLLSDPTIHLCTLVGLTESHITHESESLPIKDSSWETTHKLTDHGISVLHKTDLECVHTLSIPVMDMQVLPLLITLNGKNIVMATLYRPPGLINNFLRELDLLINSLPYNTTDCYILGDFNMDQNEQRFREGLNIVLDKYGFVQMIDKSTHQRGGILDLILTNKRDLDVGIMPLPFTDHFLTWIVIPKF